MEFMNRGVRQPQPGSPLDSEPAQHTAKTHAVSDSRLGPKGLRIAQVVLMACVAILLVAAAVLLANSNNDKNSKASGESSFVDTGKMQAVFLNNGQVYFGKIGELNKDYLTMSDIYYLRVNQQVQPGQQASQNDVSLAKLGCELHRPQDRMVINRSQIVFWENLKDDSSEQSVPGAVKKYAEANKGEQDCSQPAAGASTNGSTAPATTPATNNNRNTNTR